MQKADSQHKQAQSQLPAQQRKGAVSLESPQAEQLTQLQAMADASPQVSGAARFADMVNNNLQATVQRARIPLVSAKQAFTELYGSTLAEDDIEELEDEAQRNAVNCHGYTINGVASYGRVDEIESLAEAGSMEFFVCVKNNQVAHSGKIDGDRMKHYVMGVGIVRSNAEQIMAVYDTMYRMPQHKETYLAFADEEQAAYEARRESTELKRV